MPYKKGDLVLSSDGDITTTSVILSEKYNVNMTGENDFYYSYCLETGLYGILYSTEIASLVAENFMPEWEIYDSIFQTDWSFYDYLFEAFSFYPSFFSSGSLDPD